MEFEKKDLLSYDEIEELITNPDQTEQGKIIAEHLKKYLLIVHSELYELQSNISYAVVDEVENTILERTTNFVSTSINNLKSKSLATLKKAYAKELQWAKFLKNSAVKQIIPQIKKGIRNDTVKFDDYTNQLHFKDGYYDLKAEKFCKRVINKDFVTVFVNRKYKKPSQEAVEYVEKVYKQIFPDEKERNAVLYKTMIAFTGLARLDQELFFMLGKGSGGKSTFFKSLKCALPIYVKEFHSSTFTKGNPKQDKIMNSFAKEVYILLAWINEPEFEKMDDKLFKKICEGLVQTTKLYQDGLHDIPHKAKIEFTANDIPQILMNTGSIRRIDAYQTVREFIDENNKDGKVIDNIKYFKKDKEVEVSFENNEDYQNAVLDLIIQQCAKYNKKEKVEIPPSFAEAKDLITSSNDYIKDFIDSKLRITNNDKDRISKNEMVKFYLYMYPKKHANPLTLISALKDKNIRYEADFRCNGIKGCFVGVRLQEDDEEDEKVEEKEVDEEKKLEEIKKQGINAPQPVLYRAEEVKAMVEKVKSDLKELIYQVEDLDALKKLLGYEVTQPKKTITKVKKETSEEKLMKVKITDEEEGIYKDVPEEETDDITNIAFGKKK
jgi:hypothetical protein